MNIKMLKAALAGFVLSVSCLANAGLIQNTYNGPTGNDVDTDPASTFDIIITDNYVISDLNVQVAFGNSNYWSDISLFLSNGTTTIELMAALENDEQGLFDVTFDDSALSNLPSIGDVIGEYKSAEVLSAFNNQNISGTWTLSILDEFEPDEGDTLISFNIIATTTSVPEPTTFAIFALGIMGLAARRFKKQV